MYMNQTRKCGCNARPSSVVSNIDRTPCSLQPCKAAEGDGGRFGMIDKSMMTRTVESVDAKAIVSESKQLTESFTGKKISAACHFPNFYVSKSELEHFPMLDINWKIGSTVASKKKSSYLTMFAKKMNEKLPLCYSSEINSLVQFSFDKGPANTKPTGLQREKCSCSYSSKIAATGTKSKADSMFFGTSWTNLKDESSHVLREFSPMDVQCPVLAEEHGREVKCYSSNSLLIGQKRQRKPDGSEDMHHLPHKLLKCSLHYENQSGSCQNMNSKENIEGFHRTSSTRKCLVISDKIGAVQCHRGRLNGNSILIQAEGEALTIPIKQNIGEKEGNTAPCTKAQNITGSRELISEETETICVDVSRRPVALQGEKFLRLQQGTASLNLKKPEPTSAQPAQVLIKTVETLANRAVCECSTEACSRWFKRLQKRLKKNDASSIEMQQKISRALNCNTLSDYSELNLQSWVRRWCHNGHERARSASKPGRPLKFEAENWNSRIQPGKTESKIFASIEAMALMGKSLNKYRPCSFRRKGGSIIWST